MSRFIYSLFIGIITSNSYIKCESNTTIAISEFSTPLTKAAASVILQFFNTKTSLISISRESCTRANKLEQSDIINDILHQTKSGLSFRLESVNVLSQVPVTSKRKYNVIFIDGYKSFEQIFAPENINNYDLTGYYLLIITAYNKAKLRDTLNKIFQFAWDSYIININVLLMNPDMDKSALMYTYFPYSDRECGDTTPVMLNIFVATQFIKTGDFYPNKIRDLHKCSLQVATFHTPPYILIDQPKSGVDYRIRGFEGDLLKTLADRLNFQVNIIIPDDNEKWGLVYPNGTTTGAIKMIANNEANLTIGAWGITKERMTVMDATYNYFQSDLVLIIPPGEPYSPLEKLFLPFEPFVWIMIVLQFSLSVLVVFVLKFVSESTRNFVIGRKNSSPLFSMISVFLGGPMCYMPGRNFARTLAMIWLLSCLVIRSSYQGSLFNYLQIRTNSSSPDTIDKMIDRDMKFYVTGMGRSYLDSMPNVRDRIVNFKLLDRDYYWDRVRNSDFKGVLLSSRVHAAYANIENRLIDPYHISKQPIMLFPVTLYVRKGSYLTAQLNRELAAYMSSGLIRFWKNSIIDDRFLKREPESRAPTKMNFNHIAGGCQLCMVFLAISLIVFVLEVLSKWVGWIKKVFDFLTY